MKQLLFILLLMFLFSGCMTTKEYHLKPGDEIRVVIWKEFDEKALVRPDRKISLPMIGEISCKGKTIDELNQELSDKFDASTVLMVTKYHTYKDTIKGIVGPARDISFLYLLAK